MRPTRPGSPAVSRGIARQHVRDGDRRLQGRATRTLQLRTSRERQLAAGATAVMPTRQPRGASGRGRGLPCSSLGDSELRRDLARKRTAPHTAQASSASPPERPSEEVSVEKRLAGSFDF